MQQEKDPSIKLMSDLVHWDKYAKYLPELSRRETYKETVIRCREMHRQNYSDIGEEFDALIVEAFEYVEDKRVVPSMRGMQFSGRPVLLNNARIYNCSSHHCDSPDAFSETMFLLLAGCGVGYSVQKQHVAKLPIVVGPQEKTRKFLVGDSIEGWADAIKVEVEAHFYGKLLPRHVYDDVRKKGTLLVTSGGKAPGPEPLRRCIEQIREVLTRAKGRRLTPLEAHDIMCFIADAVLAGGIRRAAMIALFSFDDMTMRYSKGIYDVTSFEKMPSLINLGSTSYKVTYTDPERGELTRKVTFYSPYDNEDEAKLLGENKLGWRFVESQRGRANNSAVAVRYKITREDFDEFMYDVRETGSGDPGIFFTNNAEWLCNPCQPGFATVITPDGSRRLDQVDIGDQIWSAEGWTTITDKWCSGMKPVVIILTDGGTFAGTENHLVMSRGEKVPAGEAEVFDSLNHVGSFPPREKRDCGEHEVYSIIVDNDSHTYWSGGLNVANCGEASLRPPGQFCNLTSINCDGVKDQADLNARARMAARIGTLQAGYTDFHYLRPGWKDCTERDALLGISLTGIATGHIDHLDWTEAAREALAENARIASQTGINPAARVTLVKPEGTSSLVLGTCSGAHSWFAPYYIRRMYMSRGDLKYEFLKDRIPELLEPLVSDPTGNSFALCMPMKSPEGAVCSTDEPLIDFLERVKRLQTEWVIPGHRGGDNPHNVSATAYVRDDEWEFITDWMWDNRHTFTGITVLPFGGGTHVQTPFEECTKERYDELMQFVKEIDLTEIIEEEDATNRQGEVACGGGACEIV